MEDVIEFPGVGNELGDVVLDELEVGISGMVGDVVEGAGDEIVHRHDPVPFGEKPVTEVGTEETGPSRDECDRFSDWCGGAGHGGRVESGDFNASLGIGQQN
jgi:hypothetical protein